MHVSHPGYHSGKITDKLMCMIIVCFLEKVDTPLPKTKRNFSQRRLDLFVSTFKSCLCIAGACPDHMLPGDRYFCEQKD